MNNFGIETQKGFVNTWECDENIHMNVQFYWKRFGEAGRIFSHLAGIAPNRWVDRHVRYHRELGMGARTTIRTSALADGSAIVHLMENGETRDLSASAVDRFEFPVVGSSEQIKQLPEKAIPRSLQEDNLRIVDPTSFIDEGRGVRSLRSVVDPKECDSREMMLDQYHISRFSDAAAHFWGHLGVDRIWMVENNFGSVAVEMKVTRHRPVKSGMLLEIVSWLGQVGDKSFTFYHQVSDMERQEVLYSGAVTALLIDMKSRKVAPLPDQILRWQ